MRKRLAEELIRDLKKIPGGYIYDGVVSQQVCFPLKKGGELRFSLTDKDVGGSEEWEVDLYDGALPPGITGPARLTEG